MPDRLRHDEAMDWIFQIERFVARIEQSRGPRCTALLKDELEEIVELDILRSIEAAMDLAACIIVDQRYDHPREAYHDVREVRYLYFSVLVEQGVIREDTEKFLRNMAIWFFFARREYWHLSNEYQFNDLDDWLKALQELIAAVVERFSLVCPEGWEDSSGREHTRGENSV